MNRRARRVSARSSAAGCSQGIRLAGEGPARCCPRTSSPSAAGGGHPVVQGEEAVDLQTAAEEPQAAEEAAQDRSQVAPLRP